MAGSPPLAEGLADYIAAVRLAPGGQRPSPEQARLAADLNADAIAYPRPEGMTVTTSFVVREAGETAVRIYRPAGDGPQPGIVYFHGGGFTTGSLDSYEPVAMALAEASGATVISVHYARLPQSTPQAMLEECYDVLCWTAEIASILKIDTQQLAVAGDSAGAFIAALLAIRARDSEGPNLACQILCYGLFDLDEMRDAYQKSADPILTLPIIKSMIATYRECDARSSTPVAAPLHSDNLVGLPPALLVGAAYDALLDEGQDYTRRLREAGVEAQMRIAERMPHGFFRAVRFSEAARAEMRELGKAIRTYFKHEQG
ncbi:alpha/beta hydrolase [Parasphingopyxis marina]|uniref:Alpha/beta hydrolase n=1 Tax=Parasphingopyxis marina TaxID=2761622 RepID=A0A842I421_9SPHN|nr:alpha/beta hydrolase [Parasphingopyxis marina]MBC2778864.1 alpha/beta hydrolase [Parasphingopyxis marina]